MASYLNVLYYSKTLCCGTGDILKEMFKLSNATEDEVSSTNLLLLHLPNWWWVAVPEGKTRHGYGDEGNTDSKRIKHEKISTWTNLLVVD
jgi:hypothetical protein